MRRRKYKLFAAFFSATMIKPADSPVEFEVSIGNGEGEREREREREIERRGREGEAERGVKCTHTISRNNNCIFS